MQNSTVFAKHLRERTAGTSAARILLIGIGPHARRTYIPHVALLSETRPVKLCAGVDIEANEISLRAWAVDQGMREELFFVPAFTTLMPAWVELDLDRLVERHGINAVIISTEPLSHKAYAMWALSRGLHIMMDKPITTRAAAVCDVDQARGIEQDIKDLLCAYRISQASGTDTCFIINSHRRFHPGFSKVIACIEEIRDKTGCPVTSISSTHCDGQWRLPSEIVTQDYHSYNQGYGKVSHSGYHIIDSVYRFLKAGLVPAKTPDTMEMFSSFVQPDGFLHQLGEGDYLRIFGEDYSSVRRFQEKELRAVFSRFGEMDAKALVTFRKAGAAVCQAQIDLKHNGFARRTWLRPGDDLYKGNGRVKHERHEIQSGPFQTVLIESYQSRDKHDQCGPGDFEVGGNNHFDIHVFRNCGITGDDAPLETWKLSDLAETDGYDDGRLYTEQVKEAGLVEFVRCVEGSLPKSDLSSNIEDHLISAQMMSAMYVSHVLGRRGEHPVVSHAIF